MNHRLVIFGTLGVLVLSAAPALAQKDAFVAGVRELASAAAANDSASSTRVQAAADRMATSLAEWDRAIAVIDARIARDLQTARGQRAYELHLELAVAYLERGRLAESLRNLEMASQADPAASDAKVLRAVVLDLSGMRDASATLWHSVLSVDRNNPIKAYQVLRAGIGTAEARTAATAAMRAAYDRLLAKDEGGRPLTLVDIDIVPDTFSATPILGNAATARAFAALAEARYDEAIAALRRDVVAGEATTGEGPRVRFERAQQLEKANRVHEARREYEAALAGALSGRSLLYQGIGRLAQVEGDFAGAIDAFKRAVQLNPNNVNMHRELAFAYAGQGAVDDAFTELVASLLLNPREAQTFADIGRLFLDSGRDADALPPLSRALTLAPERFETRYALATALTHLGRHEDAARELAAFERGQREALDRQRRGLATPPGPSR